MCAYAFAYASACRSWMLHIISCLNSSLEQVAHLCSSLYCDTLYPMIAQQYANM